MIVLLGGVIGAGIGTFIARRRKGSTADILQYAFVYAVMFALAGLFATLIIHRFSV